MVKLNEDEERIVVVQLSLPSKIREAAKDLAAIHGVSMRQFMVDCITAGVTEDSPTLDAILAARRQRVEEGGSENDI